MDIGGSSPACAPGLAKIRSFNDVCPDHTGSTLRTVRMWTAWRKSIDIIRLNEGIVKLQGASRVQNQKERKRRGWNFHIQGEGG
jgi:hypothetical protein